MFHSLRFRFALICIGLAVAPLILAGAFIGIRSFTILERQSLVLQHKVAANVGSEIRATIEEWENELVLLDEVHRLGVLEPKEQRAILSNTLLHSRAFQELVLLNSEGQEQIRLSRTSVILDSDLESRAGNKEFLFPATSGETYLSPVRFDETIREPLVTISVPLFDQRSGEIASVLAADLRFATIWDLLAGIELWSEGDVYVTDQAGQVVAHRNPSTVLSHTTIDLPEADGRAVGLSGTDVIIARDILQFGNQAFVVIAEQPVSNALQLATDSLRITVATIAAALAFAIILVVFTTRHIVRPIEALATSARTISSGDFSQRVEVSSRDEVGQLARSFNKMAEDLAKSTTSIENLNKEITERRRTEEQLRESEERYRDLFENAHDMIQSVAPDGRFVFVNRSWLEALGYTEAELLHMSLFDIIHPESLPHCQEMFAKVMAGEPVKKVEATFVAKDGRAIQVEGNASLRRIGGKVVATQGIFRDVTQRKRAEEEIKQLYEQVKTFNIELEDKIKERTKELKMAVKDAEAANQAKSEFLSGISHELRTPLTAIIGFSQVLTEQYFGKLNKKQAEYVKDILDSGEHLLSLINDVLDLAKVEAGKVELELSRVNMKELLESSLIMIKEKASKHSLSLETHISSALDDLLIIADQRKLKQVMFNLLSNAVKFTPDHGRITVGARREGAELIVSVADTGIGIAPEDQRKIFDEFYQVRSGTRDKTPGTGLGLHLSKRFVEMHGGRIWVESEGIDKGSLFAFFLPIQGANQEAEL